jgi:hypothetical protein
MLSQSSITLLSNKIRYDSSQVLLSYSNTFRYVTSTPYSSEYYEKYVAKYQRRSKPKVAFFTQDIPSVSSL